MRRPRPATVASERAPKSHGTCQRSPATRSAGSAVGPRAVDHAPVERVIPEDAALCEEGGALGKHLPRVGVEVVHADIGGVICFAPVARERKEAGEDGERKGDCRESSRGGQAHSQGGREGLRRQEGFAYAEGQEDRPKEVGGEEEDLKVESAVLD